MNEEWKPLLEFLIPWTNQPIFYVSNLGRVRSHRFKRPYIIRTYKNTCWYEYFQFNLSSKRTSITLHKAVLLAHVWPRRAGMEVNHKDWDKSNNTLSNLEYCTRSQNMKHAYDTWLKAPVTWEKHHLHGKTWEKHHLSNGVGQYDNGILLNTFGSLREAARSVFGNASHISKCIKEGKTAYWFTWKKI